MERPRLGQLIYQRRRQLGLSLRDLEAASGIFRSGLSRVEVGKKTLQPDSLVPLSFALRLPLADLYEAAGIPLPEHLPSIRPYLRQAYDLSDEAVEEIAAYLARMSPGFTPGQGAADGEDELPE